MKYTFVNKNIIIPEIYNFNNFNDAILKLYNSTKDLIKTQCENIYVVTQNSLLFFLDQKLYEVSNDKIINKSYDFPTEKSLKLIKNFINDNNNNNYYKDDNKDDNNDNNVKNNTNDTNNNMDINFNVNKNLKNIIIDDSELQQSNDDKMIIKSKGQLSKGKMSTQVQKEAPKELSKEEQDVIKMCEEVMELYQNELKKMKDIEQKIKVIDNNQKNIIKKKKDIILTNFSKLKNDYNTFKQINKKYESNPEFEIPSLFILKFKYFQKLLNNNQISNIFNSLDNLILDTVIYEDIILDNDIVILANKYNIDSKSLNVKFDHSWEELDVDNDSSENNNSKLMRN